MLYTYYLSGTVLSQQGRLHNALEVFKMCEEMIEMLDSSKEKDLLPEVLNGKGNCFLFLGFLSNAYTAFQKADEIKEGQAQIPEERAISKANLAGVLLRLDNYTEAIEQYSLAKQLFEQTNNLAKVAVIWSQLGVTYQQAGKLEQAENAYRQSLEIDVALGDKAAQLEALCNLGGLYNEELDRPEDGVVFCLQACKLAVELGDLSKEATACNNAANALMLAGAYEQARVQLNRAMECNEQFGHNKEPWRAYYILQQIEMAENNTEAAKAAWKKAIDLYLKYRREGGYAIAGPGKLADKVIELITNNKKGEAIDKLLRLRNNQTYPTWFKQTVDKMLAIVNGNTDDTIGDDMTIQFGNATEILFFVERLQEIG
ncbi:MAG: tetratricopeptide repeat protein [Psychrosphaera sp.]|nr:tetratricopeptide repeat protein [Psychrosphaera sp.]